MWHAGESEEHLTGYPLYLAFRLRAPDFATVSVLPSTAFAWNSEFGIAGFAIFWKFVVVRLPQHCLIVAGSCPAARTRWLLRCGLRRLPSSSLGLAPVFFRAGIRTDQKRPLSCAASWSASWWKQKTEGQHAWTVHHARMLYGTIDAQFNVVSWDIGYTAICCEIPTLWWFLTYRPVKHRHRLCWLSGGYGKSRWFVHLRSFWNLRILKCDR